MLMSSSLTRSRSLRGSEVTTRLARRRSGAWLFACLSGAMLVALLTEAQGVRADASLPEAPVLPLERAQEAAQAAVTACAEDGYRVSAAVVDGSGVLRALLRADGAGPHTADSSRKKAYTALSLGEPTARLVEIVKSNPEAAGLRDMNDSILVLGGGLPIRAGDALVGGIGVGGAPGGHLDEACARAGLDATGLGGISENE